MGHAHTFTVLFMLYMHSDSPVFLECVAKGSRFTLGVWELGRVRSTLLLRLQTVRNRLQQLASDRRECKIWTCLLRGCAKASLLQVSSVTYFT